MGGWLQAAGLGVQALGNVLGSKSASRSAREAADLEYQEWLRNAGRARAAADEVNPRLQEAYDRAQGLITETAFPQADIVQQRGERAGTEALGLTREGIGYLDPYMQAGARATTSLEELGGPARKFTMEDLQLDPSYQFRLDEGAKALERSRAAKGVLMGGGTAKALERYSQGLASTEYAAAFDRFMRQQESRQKSLTSLAELGSGASRMAAEQLGTAGRFAGDIGLKGTATAADIRNRASTLVGQLGTESAGLQAKNVLGAEDEARQAYANAARAKAGGMVAQGNIRGQMWGGLGQTVGGGLSLWDMTRNRGITRNYNSPYSESDYITDVPSAFNVNDYIWGR